MSFLVYPMLLLNWLGHVGLHTSYNCLRQYLINPEPCRMSTPICLLQQTLRPTLNTLGIRVLAFYDDLPGQLVKCLSKITVEQLLFVVLHLSSSQYSTRSSVCAGLSSLEINRALPIGESTFPNL